MCMHRGRWKVTGWEPVSSSRRTLFHGVSKSTVYTVRLSVQAGTADSALPYSAFAVTTDQSLQQSQAAVRCAPRLYRPSPYHAVNTLHLGYKSQSVNAAQWNSSCLFYTNGPDILINSKYLTPIYSTLGRQFIITPGWLTYTICQPLLAKATIYNLTFISFN
jgi:hypothetical protein